MITKLPLAKITAELERQGYKKSKLPTPEIPGFIGNPMGTYAYTRNFHRILHHWIFVDESEGLKGLMVFWEENNLKRFLIKFERFINSRLQKQPINTSEAKSKKTRPITVDLIGEYFLSKKALADGKTYFLKSQKIDPDLLRFMNEYFLFIDEFFITPSIFYGASNVWCTENVEVRNLKPFTVGTPVVCIPGWRTAKKTLKKLLSRLYNVLMLCADVPRADRRGRQKDVQTAELHHQVREAYKRLKENDEERKQRSHRPTSRKEKIRLLADSFCKSSHTIHGILSRKNKMS